MTTYDPPRRGCSEHKLFDPGCATCWGVESDRLRTALERIWDFDQSETVRRIFKDGTIFGEIAAAALRGEGP